MRAIILSLLFLAALPAWCESGTLSADGDTTIVSKVRPHIHVSSGGGNGFGGGTITFYFLDDNGSWRALAGAAFTAADDVTIDSDRSITVKGTLTGSTSPTLVWVIR